MKVQVISRETIKPSYPTPHHLRTHKFSFFDQLAPPVYVPIVLFYSAASDEISPTKRSGLLKSSLSKTLTCFYPFAGRIKDCYAIDCNDDGATYIEAQVDFDMSDVLKEPKVDLLSQLLPCSPLEKLPEPSAQVMLAVQVNYFACGGMAIGVCIRHVVADASAAASFVQSWAAVANGIDTTELGAVIHDCTNLFPPQDLSNLWKIIEKNNDVLLAETVTKRFLFDGSKIASLRNEISNGISAYSPTRVEAVSSLIWRAFIAGGLENDEVVPLHVAITSVNLRKRMNPPFPKLCMGNIYHVTMANSAMANTTSVNNLAERIHESISMINDKYVRQFYGSGAHLTIIKNMAAELGNSSKAKVFSFSSWCRFPFYETDFGWGKPVWFATVLKLNQLAVFLDTSDGKGIEAWISLTKEEMTKLEQDPGILAYASFNPSK